MRLSRRDVLRGLRNPELWRRRSGWIPLPYQGDPEGAAATCASCRAGDPAPPPCAAACPERVIRADDSGAPRLDFSRAGCTFCGDCATVCGPGVLDRERGDRIRASIDLDPDGCLAWNGTLCEACADRCPERAIVFAGMWKPTVDRERCTRCGFCVSACPTSAVRIGA